MITLHIYLRVKAGHEASLERLYKETYVPAITVQRGFQSTTLLRSFGPEMTVAIQASRDWNYEIDIVFDTEKNRQAWAAGPEHTAAWPKVVELCDEITWQGFDLLG